MVTINQMNVYENATSNIFESPVNLSPNFIELVDKFEKDAKSNSYTEEELKTRALELSKAVAIGVIGSLGADFLLSFIGRS
ncbi:hypothetical protein [uncultured Cohaesibacter sp.]|uniref:hypothetical protein n=1 Tax=uncultured Cohaesibacter sp. TaxID=1002546 RepID=UPI002AA848F9|nr:hypothetical protein [uncultured Cohaesibacter sp.]